MVEHLVELIIGGLSSYFSKEGIVFTISLLPILELRGGVLSGYWLGLEMGRTSFIAVLGNLLPIPFILFFIEKVFTYMEKHNILKALVLKFRARATHKSGAIQKAEFWGLVLFVGIPLPGTGAWTGALIAEMLQIDRKKAFLAIVLGVCLALGLMLTLSYGLLNQLGL